jgi:hypothetical protein
MKKITKLNINMNNRSKLISTNQAMIIQKFLYNNVPLYLHYNDENSIYSAQSIFKLFVKLHILAGKQSKLILSETDKTYMKEDFDSLNKRLSRLNYYAREGTKSRNRVDNLIDYNYRRYYKIKNYKHPLQIMKDLNSLFHDKQKVSDYFALLYREYSYISIDHPFLLELYLNKELSSFSFTQLNLFFDKGEHHNQSLLLFVEACKK